MAAFLWDGVCCYPARLWDCANAAQDWDCAGMVEKQASVGGCMSALCALCALCVLCVLCVSSVSCVSCMSCVSLFVCLYEHEPSTKADEAADFRVVGDLSGRRTRLGYSY